MSRAQRLQERFLVIQQTLTELYGEERAFAAASAGWLMAIQYATKQSLMRTQREKSDCRYCGQGPDDNMELVEGLDAEHEAMLRGFHKEICAYLEVDPADALELSKAFEQVVDDICKQKG